MIRLIFLYGIISGLIIICTMLIGIILSDSESVGSSQALGFLVMFLAFSLIFFGVRKYRDEEQGGVITFSQALLFGLSVSAVASAVYVIVWEVYLNTSDYEFIHEYAASHIEKKEAIGVSDTELAEFKNEMAKMVEQYDNPFYRLPITFIEIFPIGLIVSLVSAFFLRSPKTSKEQHYGES